MENETVTIQTILRRIAKLPDKKRADALKKLLVISGLRGLELKITKEVKKMPITVDLSKNPFFWEIFTDGQKKGLEEGEKKGEKKGERTGKALLLRRQLERRFGELPKWASKKLDSASAEKLEKWGLQLLDAETIKEALH